MLSERTGLVPRTVRITPAVAEDWLERQFGGQRKLREHHVFLLASEMERGDFVPHNAITFAVHGDERILIDGQHRLQAVVLADIGVDMPVLEIPAESMEAVRRLYASIDQGLKRTPTDAIRALGLAEELDLPERQIQRMSGALRLIATRFTDTTKRLPKDVAKDRRAAARSNTVNARLVRDWEDEIRAYYAITEGGEKAILALFDRAPVLACALLTITVRPDPARDYWHGAALDDRLGKDDPRKRFVNWLRAQRRPKPGHVARAFAVTWRHFLRGSTLGLIKFRTTSPLEIDGVDLDAIEARVRASASQ